MSLPPSSQDFPADSSLSQPPIQKHSFIPPLPDPMQTELSGEAVSTAPNATSQRQTRMIVLLFSWIGVICVLVLLILWPEGKAQSESGEENGLVAAPISTQQGNFAGGAATPTPSPSSSSIRENKIPLPSLVGMRASEAQGLLESYGLTNITFGSESGEKPNEDLSGWKVVKMTPREGEYVSRGQSVMLLVEKIVPREFEKALAKAENYSSYLHLSKQRIYDQLVSHAEEFSPEAAQYAVDHVKSDWKANALAKAKSYENSMNMSNEAIRRQLVSEYGEQFTAEEADYAVSHLGD